MKRLVIAIAFSVALCSVAQAHGHRHHHHRVHIHNFIEGLGYGLAHMLNSRPADCYGIPWCGCYMRHKYGVSDKAYNLARNWAHYGHSASGPRIGVIVVYSHHVGVIVGGSPGHWLVESGNYRNRVATVEMPLHHVLAFREL